MSNRKNVIRRNSPYTQRLVDTQFASQPPDREAITPVQIMVFDCVSPIAEHGNKAILGHEPTEDTNIRRLQFPDCIFLSPDDAKLSCKDQMLATQERMKKIVNLLCSRSTSEQLRRLLAVKDLLQPSNKLRRAVKQSQWLIASRELDVDFYNRSIVHEVCDGRHVLNKQRFREKYGIW